jgi:hypothetical protein
VSALAAPAVPTGRAWRARVRKARRVHHGRSVGDTFTDLYMLLWLVVVYGGVLVAGIRRHQASLGGTVGASWEVWWLGMAALLVAGGLVGRGLLALGPLLATPAEQAWGLSTPVDRRSLLAPRLVGLAASGAAGGALAAAAVAFLALRTTAVGWAALAGAAVGTALTAGSVVAQVRRTRWPRVAGGAVTALGGAVALAVVVVHQAGGSLAVPGRGVVPALMTVGLPLAVAACVAATRALARLDAAALAAGAQLAAAAVTATVWLDPSLLSGVLEVRRWRAVGKVRSRPFLRLPLAGAAGRGAPARAWALLQAEARRPFRRPGALAVWVALALAQYALAVVAPSVASAARLVLAYVAAGRLTGGLSAVARSPGLRRALGGSEVLLRVVHMVIPAVGTILWWLVTASAGGLPSSILQAAPVVVVVGAAYRAATRPPVSHGGALVETPFGLVPVDLILQLARGPDLLGAALLLQALE